MLTVSTISPTRATIRALWGTKVLPHPSVIVGTCSRYDGDAGLLLRLADGTHVQGAHGTINRLSRDAVNAALRLSSSAAAMGRKGKGESKRRDVDYADMARKSHEARKRNNGGAK